MKRMYFSICVEKQKSVLIAVIDIVKNSSVWFNILVKPYETFWPVGFRLLSGPADKFIVNKWKIVWQWVKGRGKAKILVN